MIKTRKLKRKTKKIRYSEYYGMVETLDRLHYESTQNKEFHDMMPIITSRENILLAFRNIKSNTGSKTKGTDGKTIKDIKEQDIEYYVMYIQRLFENYHPKTVRRIEIPKPIGKTRPLGIPTMIDRLIQQCILQVLDPICEAKFNDNSYGFRPNRSVEHAIANLVKKMQKDNLHYCVDIDIKGFFDNVNHGKLLKQMWALGIQDKQLISIMPKILKSDIELPNGKVILSSKGTPQGGIISPLLSNIVLNELDWWICSQWSEFIDLKEVKLQYKADKITRNKSNEYRRMRSSTKLKEIYIVRYADDFKILCIDYKTAQKIYIAIEMWLKDRLKLEVSREKSKITNLRKNNTEFLGFKLKVRPKKGEHVVKSHISDKAKKNITETLRKQIKVIQHSDKDTHKQLGKYNAIVMGQHNYYQIASMCSIDFSEIAFIINRILKNRLKPKRKQLGEEYLKNTKNFILERYGESRQMRYLQKRPIIPIGYVKTKNPMNKIKSVNRYTVEGRKEIHKNLGLDGRVIRHLMIYSSSNTVEYNDNRISLYAGQQGKCYITNQALIVGDIHCHHKKLKSKTNDDSYDNLVLIKTDVHKLIHASVTETINKYLNILKLEKKQINKVNKLRKLISLEAIQNS